MNGEEQALSREITADAQKRADRARQRAEREAAKVLEDAKQEAAGERERLLEQARALIGREQGTHEARVRQAVARLHLEACQAALDEVRREALAALRALPRGPGYRDGLRRLAVRAIQAMSGGRFLLVLRPEDRDADGRQLADDVRNAVREELDRDVQVDVADESVGAIGGLVVKSAEGHELADQTYEARMDRLWDQMRRDVAAILLDTGPRET